MIKKIIKKISAYIEEVKNRDTAVLFEPQKDGSRPVFKRGKKTVAVMEWHFYTALFLTALLFTLSKII